LLWQDNASSTYKTCDETKKRARGHFALLGNKHARAAIGAPAASDGFGLSKPPHFRLPLALAAAA
jgi:hypothetical protein